jgi:lysophospholipase L1-like esterase
MIDSLRFPLWPVMVVAVLSAAPAHAQGNDPLSPAGLKASAKNVVAHVKKAQCSASKELSHLDRPLTRTARLIAAGLPVKIVALGSSSTAGAGASEPWASYPSQLEMQLGRRFPNNGITVINRGVNGEEAEEMLARLEAQVLSEKPDLVLWQVGTNAVLRDNPIEPASSLIDRGIERIKAAGADVILIDPQFAPQVIKKSKLARMLDLLSFKAKQYNVNLFQRFAVMRDWRERQGLSFETFVASDQLHMNDWSYSCVAKVLSVAIAEAATRPVASASARPAR